MVVSHDGGSGGAGGKGGDGGDGGSGGLGGSTVCSELNSGMFVPASCSGSEFQGGDGGNGAAGMAGGAGGGGAGGHSFAIYCHQMTFEPVPTVDLKTGSPGRGGHSVGNAGTEGLSSTLYNCQ